MNLTGSTSTAIVREFVDSDRILGGEIRIFERRLLFWEIE